MTDELTETPPEETSPEPEIVDDDPNSAPIHRNVALEVIAGRWGRGNARKRRLTEAGYDPAEIQREVDRIFKTGS